MFGCEGGTTSIEDLTGCTSTVNPSHVPTTPENHVSPKGGLQIAAEARELTRDGHVDNRPCLNEESGQPP
jgi:hypothetical protein